MHKQAGENNETSGETQTVEKNKEKTRRIAQEKAKAEEEERLQAQTNAKAEEMTRRFA